MLPALAFPEPDPFLEATGDTPARRAQRANRAAQDVLRDRNATERDAVQRLNQRLTTLKTSLNNRLLAGDGGVTDFQRFTLGRLLEDVDRMIGDTTRQITADARPRFENMADLGQQAADDPMRAAQLQIVSALPGLGPELVTTAFDNMADLLTQPMQQFAGDVKVSLRRVALAGESRMAEIQRLRDQIKGAGFDNAQFRAERIIRTEMGRVFNESTFTRLVALARDFPFLRKGWRSATDNRVRAGHREASQTYARGSGIVISAMFVVNVHVERKGVVLRVIGQARLRFPIDPAAEPRGRVAAAATIMCRCNSFVDFDLSEFAQFTAQQIQLALGGVRPPVAPGPTPAPAAPAVPPPPRRPARPRARRPAAPPSGGAFQPAGPAVSGAVDLDAPVPFARPGRRAQTLPAGGRNKLARAYAIIDSVHGDGTLPRIPARGLGRRQARAGALAYYSRTMNDVPLELGFGSKALSSHPHMATFHETGHFLDHVGFDGDRTTFSSGVDPGFAGWRTAVKNSEAIQMLGRWRAGTPGDGIVPSNLNRNMVDYMLSTKEVWARSYAQWVAVKSQNPAALKELRTMQAASQVGDVPTDRRYNGRLPGQQPNTDSWDYPWAWQDEDFKAIESAIDELMERIGWRTRRAG